MQVDIRTTQDHDLDSFYELWSSPEITKTRGSGLASLVDFNNWIKSKKPTDLMFSLFVEDKYIGQLMYDNQGRGIYVHIMLLPEYQRQGIGPQVIGETLPTAYEKFGNRDVVALIKEENFNSIKMFCNLGFKYNGRGMTQNNNLLVRYTKKPIGGCHGAEEEDFNRNTVLRKRSSANSGRLYADGVLLRQEVSRI